MRCGAFHRVEGTLCLVRHGQAALSGSKTKAPGFAGGYLLGAVVLRAIMDISARAVLLADRPRMGHLGHQCSHAPVRPILHLVSSSRRPRRETGCRGYVIDRSLSLCSSFVRA